ncbi:type II toxin-antitoxin system HigB family toxin [Arcticibacter eurypsychrophilus]
MAKINYTYKIIPIRFMGTHAEYDKINANKIEQDYHDALH